MLLSAFLFEADQILVLWCAKDYSRESEEVMGEGGREGFSI